MVKVNEDTTLELFVSVCDRFIKVHEEDRLYKNVREQWELQERDTFLSWFRETAILEGLSLSIESKTNITAWVSRGENNATPS